VSFSQVRRRPTLPWLAARGRASATRASLLLVNALQGGRLVPRVVRWGVLRLWGADVATHRISEGCWFGGRDIHIGAGTFVNFGCVFDNLAAVRIGARCDLGMRVMFVTSTHEIGPAERRAGAVGGQPVTVGDGCWIGAGAIILPGVTVGSGCIVAAGAVVTRDCEPDGVYAGNPARRLERELP
jgi:maltose O-acetyltransferase